MTGERERDNTKKVAYFHLPGLFEFYELYRLFLPLFRTHRDYFFDDCEIGSLYGAPADCLWGGGRVGFGEDRPKDVLDLCHTYGVSARLTFSNGLLRKEHLSDKKCNRLCEALSRCSPRGGVIVASDLLTEYLRLHYPDLYLVSSTTKVLLPFERFENELKREEFSYVVPDFRLNKAFDRLNALPEAEKAKTEFLCNECCPVGCTDRKACYDNVSRKNLGEDCPDFACKSAVLGGYRFSEAMKHPCFIGIEEIRKTYLPMGFSQFKIEGRSLGSALVLEFLLYYLTKPEYRLTVREEIYLENTLDLF